MYGAPKEIRAQAARDGDTSAKAAEIWPYRLTQEYSLPAEFTTGLENRLLSCRPYIPVLIRIGSGNCSSFMRKHLPTVTFLLITP
jgi:hypothetical protein